jgi:phosphatidate cytidylyltransferase
MTRRILTAAILIPIVLVSLFFFPLPAFLLVVDIFLFLALYEFSKLLQARGSRVYLVCFVIALIAPWIVNYAAALTGPFLLFAILTTLSWGLFSTNRVEETLPGVAGNLLALCYLAIPFSLISTFHPASSPPAEEFTRPLQLVFVLIIIWVSDAAALFVGKAIGRHKITPSISPNKTLEGYLAALLLPILVALLIGTYFLPDSSLPYLALISLIVAVTGTLGDLFESILKRGAGLKDTSNLIPGHGGVLDRVDSLLFAVPAYSVSSILLA